MQVILVVGIATVLFLTAFVAGLSNVECQRAGVASDCQTIVEPPTLQAPTGGGFFTAAANMIGFLFSSIGYGISLIAIGFGFPIEIVVVMTLMLGVGITYVILKLLSLGGG